MKNYCEYCYFCHKGEWCDKHHVELTRDEYGYLVPCIKCEFFNIYMRGRRKDERSDV